MFFKKIIDLIFKFKRDERGVVVIITALLLALLFAFMGLAVDVGNAFLVRTQMQAAADAAALAGATDRKYRSNSAADIASAITVAQSISAQNGFANGQDGITVEVRVPPLINPSALPNTPPPSYSDDNKYVRVIITKTNVPLFFAPLIGVTKTWTVTANAVAGFVSSPDCFVASNSLENKGGPRHVLTNCSIAFGVEGFTSRGSGGFDLRGGNFNQYNNGTFICFDCSPKDPIVQSGPLPTFPVVALPTGLPLQTNCSGNVCQPGIYNSKLSLNNGNYIFNSGNYVFNAGFEMNTGTNITGTGVLLYFNSNKKDFVNFQGNVTLTAPTPSNCAVGSGIVIYSSNNVDVNLIGNANVTLTGIIDLPNQSFKAGGVSTFTLFGSLLAKDITLDGTVTSQASANPCNNFVAGSKISLVE